MAHGTVADVLAGDLARVPFSPTSSPWARSDAGFIARFCDADQDRRVHEVSKGARTRAAAFDDALTLASGWRVVKRDDQRHLKLSPAFESPLRDT